MAQEEELKKWKALEHICVCFLPGQTVKQLDILLNPSNCLGDDWKKVADKLGYPYTHIEHLGSLVKSHGSHFQNMLEDYRGRKFHSVLEFVQALYATGRQDVKDAIKNTYEDVNAEYHRFKHTEAARYSCNPDHVKSLQCGGVVHCYSHPPSPRCGKFINGNHHCHPGYQQLLPPPHCQHQQNFNPHLTHAKQQPMDIDMDYAATPAMQTDAYPHQQQVRLTPKVPTPTSRAYCTMEGIKMKSYLKSELGLEHPPYIPVPSTVRDKTMVKIENKWEPDQEYRREQVVNDQRNSVGTYKEFQDIPVWTIVKTESLSEARETSTDSSGSATFPPYGKSDIIPDQLRDKLRSTQSQSTESRLETAPYTKGIKEVFLTYPDDKPIMQYVYQLLENLQRNKFKTSADEKDKSEAIPEKVIKRFKRSDFVIVCISPKYKEQISPSSPLNFINKAEKLHTAKIYDMMQQEVAQNARNDRFIPVLLKGAGVEDIPEWLRQICPSEIFYQWPTQYKSLLFHLLQPHKLVERYQRSMRDMTKRSLQSGDKKSQPHSKHTKYNSSGY